LVCPYYKNGACYSPSLDQPDASVTSKERCLKNFKVCRYFQNETKLDIKNFYFEMKTKLSSECNYYELKDVGSGFVAYCKVLNRIITESQAINCNKYWNDCPLRAIMDIHWKVL